MIYNSVHCIARYCISIWEQACDCKLSEIKIQSQQTKHIYVLFSVLSSLHNRCVRQVFNAVQCDAQEASRLSLFICVFFWHNFSQLLSSVENVLRSESMLEHKNSFVYCHFAANFAFVSVYKMNARTFSKLNGKISPRNNPWDSSIGFY